MAARLGDGGHSTVFLVMDADGSQVAVKQPNPTQAAQENLMFEIAILSTFSHVNVVKFIRTDMLAGVPYLFMEYCQGGCLDDRIELGPSAQEATLRWFAGVASGLAALHASKITHFDIKPGNLLFRDQETLIITDFGCACLIDGDEYVDDSRGTAQYSPPEYFIGSGFSTPSDIWALGMCMLECATGKYCCPDDLAETERRVTTACFKIPMETIRDAPKVLGIVAMAMHLEPKKRVIAEVVEHLCQEALLDGKSCPSLSPTREADKKLKSMSASPSSDSTSEFVEAVEESNSSSSLSPTRKVDADVKSATIAPPSSSDDMPGPVESRQPTQATATAKASGPAARRPTATEAWLTSSSALEESSNCHASLPGPTTPEVTNLKSATSSPVESTSELVEPRKEALEDSTSKPSVASTPQVDTNEKSASFSHSSSDATPGPVESQKPTQTGPSSPCRPTATEAWLTSSPVINAKSVTSSPSSTSTSEFVVPQKEAPEDGMPNPSVAAPPEILNFKSATSPPSSSHSTSELVKAQKQIPKLKSVTSSSWGDTPDFDEVQKQVLEESNSSFSPPPTSEVVSQAVVNLESVTSSPASSNSTSEFVQSQKQATPPAPQLKSTAWLVPAASADEHEPSDAEATTTPPGEKTNHKVTSAPQPEGYHEEKTCTMAATPRFNEKAWLTSGSSADEHEPSDAEATTTPPGQKTNHTADKHEEDEEEGKTYTMAAEYSTATASTPSDPEVYIDVFPAAGRSARRSRALWRGFGKLVATFCCAPFP